MLLSKKLLGDFFSEFKKISDKDLIKAITAIGAEVESVYNFEQVNNLIVGEITHVEKHPKSEKLNLCTVLVNNKKRLIVCGASNVKPDARVIVALEDAEMVDGRVIKYKELLGIESQGMICAYNELTKRTEFLNSIDADNVIILDSNAKVNDTNPLKYINLDDTIFDISLPSNRNELNGIIGLVCDLMPHLNFKKPFDFSISLEKNKKNNIKIKTDEKICSFFGTIELSNLKNHESNWKVKSYLMNSGIKPINWLVDIGNLNMILTGNGAHSYDRKFIGNEIDVNLSTTKNKFLALNNKEYEVDSSSIFIKSKNKNVSLAGIIGSLESSITDDTNSVVYEVANFNNNLVKKTSAQIGLTTDASALFSKKIPLWITIKSFETLINLLKESNSNFLGISYTKYNFRKINIKYDLKKINSILGKEFKDAIIKKYLKLLGFKINGNNLTPPIYREDIINIYDVAEEILKMVGIENLDLASVEDSLVSFKDNNFENNLNLICEHLLFKGFSEVKTYNLISIENVKKFNLFKSKKIEKVLNPISKEREYLRTSLISQLLNVITYNKSYKNDLVPIFEIQGLTYDESWHQHLCILIPCEIFKNNVNKSKLTNDIFLVKSIIWDLLNYFNVEINFDYGTNDNDDLILKNDSLVIKNSKNKVIGILGRLSPKIISKGNGEEKYYFAEIRCDDFINKNLSNTFSAKEIDYTHKISRNLTVTLNNNQNYKDLEKILSDDQNIDNYFLEDVYKDESNNEISYTFDINFKKIENNISLENINNIFKNIIYILEKNGYVVKKSI